MEFSSFPFPCLVTEYGIWNLWLKRMSFTVLLSMTLFWTDEGLTDEGLRRRMSGDVLSTEHRIIEHSEVIFFVSFVADPLVVSSVVQSGKVTFIEHSEVPLLLLQSLLISLCC
jgi:hypothetical protein